MENVRYNNNVVSLRKKIIRLIMNNKDGYIPVNCAELYPLFGTERLSAAINSFIDDKIVQYRDSEGITLEFVK